MGPWMKPVVRWPKVAKSLQSLGSLMLSELAQWVECTLDSLSHHITSHCHLDNFQQTNYGWIFYFPWLFLFICPMTWRSPVSWAQPVMFSPWLTLKSTGSVEGPTVTSSALLMSELSPRFSLLLLHPCRQLEGSLFWGLGKSLSQKANIDAIWGRSF